MRKRKAPEVEAAAAAAEAAVEGPEGDAFALAGEPPSPEQQGDDVGFQTSTKKAKRSGGGKAKPRELAPSVDLTDPLLQRKAVRLVEELTALFPDPPIPLDHSSTFQLLVAVMLSAQTTDIKVRGGRSKGGCGWLRCDALPPT